MHRLHIAALAATIAVPTAASAQTGARRPPKQVQPAAPSKAAPDGFHGDSAHCYFDRRTLTWRIGNDAVEQTIRFDRDAGALRTVGVKTMRNLPAIAEVATDEGAFMVEGSSTPIRLDRDWQFGWQSVVMPDHGRRVLTIHLDGVRSHSGLGVEAVYDVRVGDRPYLGKSLTLINRTPAPITVSEVSYGRWVLVGPLPAKSAAPPAASAAGASAGAAGFTMTDPKGRTVGLRAFVAGPQSDVTTANGALVVRAKGPFVAAVDGGRVQTPLAVVFPYVGGTDVASSIERRYVANPLPPINLAR